MLIVDVARLKLTQQRGSSAAEGQSIMYKIARFSLLPMGSLLPICAASQWPPPRRRSVLAGWKADSAVVGEARRDDDVADDGRS